MKIKYKYLMKNLNFKNMLPLRMHDIIGLISESADNGFKCKHRPDMINDADMFRRLEE